MASRAGAGHGSATFSPTLVTEVELNRPLPALHGAGYRRARVLARLMTEPVGVCALELTQDGLSPDDLGARLWAELAVPLAGRLRAAGTEPPGRLDGAGLLADPAASPFLQRRARVLGAAPFISVVTCTCDRPDRVGRCLKFLDQQEYPDFEVIVVNNAPGCEVSKLVATWDSQVPFRYVEEPARGASRARNRGAAVARGDIIAFLDDDEAPDRHWLAEVAAGFARGDDIGCVTGPVLPAELETPAQELFEQLGGHVKGRGFTADIFARRGGQSPVYPRPPFGAGGNMALRRAALEAIGGFDVALGPGTPTLAGEDTLALTLVLLAGYRIAYQPGALMWHHHRRDLADLGGQLRGYSLGLAAYYAAVLRHRPAALADLLRLAPLAARHLRDVPSGQPAGLAPFSGQWRHHLLAGPAAYTREVLRARTAPGAGQLRRPRPGRAC